MAAHRRDADHLGRGPGHRHPGRGRGGRVPHRALPARLRGDALGTLVELLAAVPSVVYGLWGVFVLIPKLGRRSSGSPTRSRSCRSSAGKVAGPNYFIGGLILAIMIIPIVSSISREVMATVPAENKEAALALGATRWEMIRMAVLPYSRRGHLRRRDAGARPGDRRDHRRHPRDRQLAAASATRIFDQGYTLAAVVANEFGEAASDPIHRAALIAAGLVLFVLTLLVNLIARFYVVRAERGQHRRASAASKRRSTRRYERAPADQRPPAPHRRRDARAVRRRAPLLALVPLGLILFYLLRRGLGAWSWHFFTSDPTGRLPGQTRGGDQERDHRDDPDRRPRDR